MATQQSPRMGYREKQRPKKMPPIDEARTGSPEEMNAIGEKISGHQPEIGDKSEGRANRRSKRRRNQRAPTP
jgi:hypothetical protein